MTTAGWIPIGSGASSYITGNTFLMFYGGDGYEFTRFSYAIAKIPMIIALSAYVVFFASKIAPEKKETDDNTQLEGIGRMRQTISTVVFIIVLLCLILVDILPVTSWQICLGGALLMLLSGILCEKEAVSSLRIPLILLYVGALTMGQALSGSPS